MELRHHALGELLDLHFGPDIGALEEGLGLVEAEIGMDAGEQRKQFAHPQEARQARHIGNEGDIAHQAGPVGKGVLAQHANSALAIGEAQHGIERRGLARAVMADQPVDAAGRNVEIQAMQDLLAAEFLAQAARRNDGFAGRSRRGRLSHYSSPGKQVNW